MSIERVEGEGGEELSERWNEIGNNKKKVNLFESNSIHSFIFIQPHIYIGLVNSMSLVYIIWTGNRHTNQ